MKLDGFSVILVGVIVTLLSVVIMLSLYVHVSSTELVSIVEVIVIEQMISCNSPTTPCRKPLGRKEILETSAMNNHYNNIKAYFMQYMHIHMYIHSVLLISNLMLGCV